MKRAHHSGSFFSVLFISLAVVLVTASPVLGASATDIANSITQTNSEIEKIGKQIDTLNSQISSLNAQIAANEQQLAQKQKDLETQKQNMGERARVMYEYGEGSYLSVLFASEDASDFLSRLDKVTTIMKADSEAISTTEETEQAIYNTNQQLTKDKQSLDASKAQQVAAQNEQQSKLAEEQKQLSAYQAAAKAEGIDTSSTTGTNTTTGNATAAIDNMDFICAVVCQEGGSSYEGALAVISCMMNRVDSGAWGGSDIISVITAPGQFAAYLDGAYTKYLGQDLPEVRQAVTDCMQGGKRSHSYQSFRSYYWIDGCVNICGNYYH